MCKSGIISGVIGGLVVLFVDKMYIYLDNKKFDRKKFKNLINKVLIEINYNIESGVGNLQNNFRLTAHEELLNQNKLDDNLKNEIEILVNAARQCNSFGGIKNLKIQPGAVKEMSNQLKNKLIAL